MGATMNMLVKVDPYIMYGYPNLKTVLCCHLLCKPFEGNNTCRHRQLCVGSRQHSFYSYATLVQFRPRSPSQVKDLVYKRGFAKVGGQRVPLTNNCIIEKALDQKNQGRCHVHGRPDSRDLHRGPLLQGVHKIFMA